MDLAWEAWTGNPHGEWSDTDDAARALNRSWHALRVALRCGEDAEVLLARRYADLAAAARATLPHVHPDARRALNAVCERAAERAAELRRPVDRASVPRGIARAEATGEQPRARTGAVVAAVQASRARLNTAHAAWRAGEDIVPRGGAEVFAALDRAWTATRDYRPVEGIDEADGATRAEQAEQEGRACLTLAHHAHTLAALPQGTPTRARLHDLRVHAEHTAHALRALARLTNPPPPYADDGPDRGGRPTRRGAADPPSTTRPIRARLTARTLGAAIARTELTRPPAPDRASDPDGNGLRALYRADRTVMRAVWHRAWWARATPEDIAQAWTSTSRWAASGSAYAATTLRRLRGRVRQYTGLEPPPPNPGPDLSAALAAELIHPPHGHIVWWHCTAHDPTTGTQVLPESREPATAWEHPEEVAARIHADLEHIHGLRADILRRVHITTTPETTDADHRAAVGTRVRSTDINRIRQRAALRHRQEHHTTRRAALLRQDLDTTWRSTATPAETTALEREVRTWPPGPTREDMLTFLQHQT
ncbi:hypothetical protein [Embleya scabrispora]|uniref:hypothetical protein n=1 Tax=Embleya scabrispora TaxID=159449 RepID=UPI0003609529|nr:hypothetical protein [Embleya scabrispora]MYS81041.1 hypothetical protein [Streptomyces sp. SID5474]